MTEHVSVMFGFLGRQQEMRGSDKLLRSSSKDYFRELGK